jgi:hypothetical protein
LCSIQLHVLVHQSHAPQYFNMCVHPVRCAA